MEELQSEELEDLVQELEGESGAEESLPPEVEEGSPSPSDGAVRHLEEAFALEDEGEYEKALEECHAAILLDPTMADAHNLRGVILEELGRNGEAIQAYREVLRLDPGFAAAHENLRAAEAELDEYRIGPRSRRLRCKRKVEDLRRCPNSASFRCAECGDALCRTHAMLFRPPDARSGQDGDSGVYCPFHYRVVVDRANLQAAEAELAAEEAKRETHRADKTTRSEEMMEEFAAGPILFEAEDGDSAYAWLAGRVDLLPATGTIMIYEYPEGELTITIPVTEIVGCQIVEREDIRYLSRRLEISEGSDHLGCTLVFGLFVVLVDIVEGMIARAAKVPVIKLTQSSGADSGQGWVLHLRSVKRGRRGRVATHGIAYHIVAFLRGAGYQGTVPEELSEPTDLEAFVEEGSVSTDLEVSRKRKWFAGGILASFFSYVAGLLVAGYLVEPWNLSVSEYLDILLDMHLGLSTCCGLPGLALSLFVLGVAILRPKEPKRSAIVVITITFAILNLAIGCGVGMFNMLYLSTY